MREALLTSSLRHLVTPSRVLDGCRAPYLIVLLETFDSALSAPEDAIDFTAK